MKKFIPLLVVYFIVMIISLTFQSCFNRYNTTCSGEDMIDHFPIYYDTFELVDSAKFWNFDSSLYYIEYEDSLHNIYKFHKNLNYARGYNYVVVERVPADYFKCINEGLNYVLTEGEWTRWDNVDIGLSIIFLKSAVSKENYNFLDTSKLKDFYLGECYRISFLPAYGEFYVTTDNFYENNLWGIDTLSQITLNGIQYSNVLHCYYASYPGTQYYMKGVYFKWGYGLIAFYDSKGMYWYLK